MNLEEKILSFYINNCELKPMTEFEKGYFKALTDILGKKTDPYQIIQI
jgi:hypothetical protein